MNRRILPLILSALSLFAFAFGFTACKDGGKTKHTHSYGEWEIYTPATCTEAGEKRRYCACFDYEKEIIPALGHDLESIAAKAPSCYEVGWEAYQACRREGCGYTTYSEIAMIPHDYSVDYYENNKCTVCGYEKLKYELSADGGSYIITELTEKQVEQIIIPAEHDGKPVTAVADKVFSGLENLKSVTIPETIESIGAAAFSRCDALESVYITDVGAWCEIDFKDKLANPLYFADNLYINNKLATEIVIPDSVNKISKYAFYECQNITGVDTGSGVKTIGESAFYNCQKLMRVTIGSGLTIIEGVAFGKCDALESVYITDVGAWCEIEFKNKSSNPFYFADNLYINNKLATEIVIPDSVNKISKYAFYECQNITGVDTGSGVKTIGEEAFYNCPKLRSVKIGEGVEVIDDSAFADCLMLNKLTLGGNLNSIENYAFANCTALTEAVIPSSVENIGEGAFIECLTLSKLTLNDGLKTIGDAAFAGCISLGSLIMPDSVTSIGWGMVMFNAEGIGFGGSDYYSNELKEIVVSNSLTEIPDFAFSKSSVSSVKIGEKVKTIKYSSFFGCTFLESIVIPKSLTRIESYSFYRCEALSEVFYEGTQAEWNKIFIGKNGNDISTATKYFYSETQPSAAGNFWHYVDGTPTIW